MTNYAQPQGIENWPEDLRRRYLEAMQKQSAIPTATDEQINLLMQQERLQALLNKASPTTAAPAKGMNLSTPPADPAFLKLMRRGRELEPGYAGPSTFVPSRETSPAASTAAGYLDETTVPRTQFMEPPRVSQPAGTWSPSEGGSAAVVEYPPVVTSVSGHDDPDKVPDASANKTTKVPPKDTSEYDDYMKSLWGRYASDPEARKKMYLSQLNKIYAKSMLLDGWASITGGESRGSAYAAAATDVLDKTEKFDSEIRIHNIWKAAMFKDGKYYPPKTIPDFYERLQALGATPDEIAILIKGVSGKSFRDQAALEVTPKRLPYYNTQTNQQFMAFPDDPRVAGKDHVMQTTLPSGAELIGKKVQKQLANMGKRYKTANTEDKSRILEKAVLLLEGELFADENLMFRLRQHYEDDFRTPKGKRKIVLRLMGVYDPSAGDFGEDKE